MNKALLPSSSDDLLVLMCRFTGLSVERIGTYGDDIPANLQFHVRLTLRWPDLSACRSDGIPTCQTVYLRASVPVAPSSWRRAAVACRRRLTIGALGPA